MYFTLHDMFQARPVLDFVFSVFIGKLNKSFPTFVMQPGPPLLFDVPLPEDNLGTCSRAIYTTFCDLSNMRQHHGYDTWRI